MCKVSEKFKLCTCANGSMIDLQHYWVLHRYSAIKKDFIMGMPILPSMVDPVLLFENTEAILDRLNEGDAFDFEITFQDKDCLEIVLNHDEMNFTFTYKKGKWTKDDQDFFSLENYYNNHLEGEVKGVSGTKE
jgi:hypothetical protein